MTQPVWRGYRGLLRNTVISSAAPYGYTLTTWTTGLPATQAAATAPTVVDALLIAVPGMISRGYGRIVYLGAVLSQRPREGMIAAGTAKTALSSSTRYVARDLGPGRITASVVAPGPVDGLQHSHPIKNASSSRRPRQHSAASPPPDDVARPSPSTPVTTANSSPARPCRSTAG